MIEFARVCTLLSSEYCHRCLVVTGGIVMPTRENDDDKREIN